MKYFNLKTPESFRQSKSNLLKFIPFRFEKKNSKGLADAINSTYLPDMLPEEEKKKAKVLYYFLILVYIAYGIFSVISALEARRSPSIRYSKTMDETNFKAPYFTYCVPLYPYTNYSEFQFNTSCDIISFDESSQPCDYSTFEIVTGYENKCCVFEIKEELTALEGRIDLRMNVTTVNSTEELEPYYYYNFYLSDFKPDDGIEFDAEERFFDFGGYHDGFHFEVEVGKLVKSSLNAYWGGLRTNPSEEVSYNTFTHFAGQIADNFALAIDLRANFQGVENLKEIDTFDLLSVIGSIAGLSSYIAIFFMLYYRNLIYEYMKKLEKDKIEEIVDERMIDTHFEVETSLEKKLEISSYKQEEKMAVLLKKTEENSELIKELWLFYQKDKIV
mmetsp:Transcript_5619/g.7929  ORF Transcript_5619/g.7929 Transcript_5619/m.7929 type:complete len:388 (-) Transcript_5619:16-1179(-)